MLEIKSNFEEFRTRFANYDGAKIERLAFSGNDTKVEAAIVTAQHQISIVAEGSHDDAVLVYGPASGGEFRPYIKVGLFIVLAVMLEGGKGDFRSPRRQIKLRILISVPRKCSAPVWKSGWNA